MEELMLKIDNVKKRYKLGEIGGTTLREELQRLGAKIRHKEDPTKMIGAKNYNKGDIFMALDGVSFDVKKGERVGIIGHNGAGKSTLLKLISRVTAPTDGTISMNGRVASMLEVGTGFHGELTGRENIYMNGAILGMTKKEIDAKMEQIIDFSEVRQFIDTPVKRYSSGMFVKLAFAVASHLDAEIMIMDEVLAVGDMAFQKKCIEKMNQVSKEEDKTILYVSHNMNTIRQLCDRVVVLDHGKVVFNGDVEEGIGIYLEKGEKESKNIIDLHDREHYKEIKDVIDLNKIIILGKDSPIFSLKEKMNLKVFFESRQSLDNIRVKMIFRSVNDDAVGTTFSNAFSLEKGKKNIIVNFDLSNICYGKYYISFGFVGMINEVETRILDHVSRAFAIKIIQDGKNDCINWQPTVWGRIMLHDSKVYEEKL